ncbi:LysE family translocator [Halovulum sp. GXIMD14793]
MSIELATLLTFVPAALALNLTPGTDMMMCLAQGIGGGPRAGVAASAGVSLGGVIHATIAGLGLGALVAALPWLFDAIRWLGVAYLLWLTLKMLRSGVATSMPQGVSARHAFCEGLIVSLTNPKVILFILAFVPQFVDPSRPVLVQFLIFGGILSLGGLFINGLAGVFAGGLGRRLATAPRLGQALGAVSAGIFAALALRLALMERA